MPRSADKTTFVVADDDSAFRYAVARCLGPEHQVLASVEDGEAAVVAVEKHRPDIALLDISMPRMNGLEATARISASVPSVKIIIMSCYADRSHVEAAYERGAKGYVLKGKVAELHDAIRVVMSGHLYRPIYPTKETSPL